MTQDEYDDYVVKYNFRWATPVHKLSVLRRYGVEDSEDSMSYADVDNIPQEFFLNLFNKRLDNKVRITIW